MIYLKGICGGSPRTILLSACILLSTVFLMYSPASIGKEASGSAELSEFKDYYYDINFNWLGIGYNLVYLDPDNYAAPAFENPNLKIPPAVFSIERGTHSGKAIKGTTFMIPRGVNFYPGSANSLFDSTYQEIRSGNDYRKEMHGSISLSGGVKGIFSASGSTSFKQVQEKTRNSEERIYQVKGTVEGHRLEINLKSPGELTLSPEFRSAARKLGKSLSYRDFINTWGTHFASAVVYGGKAYFRMSVEKEFISKYNLTEMEFNTAVEGTFKKITTSIKGSAGSSREATETEENMFRKIRAIAYGGKGSVIEQDIRAYNEWAESVRDNPTAIRLALTEYHELFTEDFFPEDNEIDEKRTELEAEIKKYLAEHYVDSKESGNFFDPGQLFKCRDITFIESWWDGNTDRSIARDVYGRNNGILHGAEFVKLPDGDEIFSLYPENGNSSYISVQHSDLFTRLTQDKSSGHSISLWISPGDIDNENSGRETLLIKGNSREEATFALYMDTGPPGNRILRFTQKVKYHRKRWCKGIGGDKCAKDDSGYRVYTAEKDITGMLVPGEWIHVAAVFNNKWHEETMSVCANGECDEKDPKRPGRYGCGAYKCREWAIKNVVNYPQKDLLMGIAPGGEDRFSGKMDDIQIFSGILTDADIMAIYQRGRDKDFVCR